LSRVSLVLVTFNRAETLKKILNTIHSFDWEYEYFIIIDNCSNDNTFTILSEFKNKLNSLKILRTNTNIGHGAALAEGFKFLEKKSHSTYYILLEDDSIPDFLLLDRLKQAIISSTFGIISSFGMKVSLGKRKPVNPSLNEIVEADFCLLDGAIIRSELINTIGYPTFDWFMMFDDYEYCYRITDIVFRRRRDVFKI